MAPGLVWLNLAHGPTTWRRGGGEGPPGGPFTVPPPSQALPPPSTWRWASFSTKAPSSGRARSRPGLGTRKGLISSNVLLKRLKRNNQAFPRRICFNEPSSCKSVQHEKQSIGKVPPPKKRGKLPRVDALVCSPGLCVVSPEGPSSGLSFRNQIPSGFTPSPQIKANKGEYSPNSPQGPTTTTKYIFFCYFQKPIKILFFFRGAPGSEVPRYDPEAFTYYRLFGAAQGGGRPPPRIPSLPFGPPKAPASSHRSGIPVSGIRFRHPLTLNPEPPIRNLPIFCRSPVELSLSLSHKEIRSAFSQPAIPEAGSVFLRHPFSLSFASRIGRCPLPIDPPPSPPPTAKGPPPGATFRTPTAQVTETHSHMLPTDPFSPFPVVNPSRKQPLLI